MAYEIPSEGAKRCMIYKHDPNPLKKTDEKETLEESPQSTGKRIRAVASRNRTRN